jgi:hypothetical protein
VSRAAPGPQLSVGRLRVDAARAIAKLREYQLADRTMWVLEAIRAAVASDASEIELRGDANDVWLAWHCVPWAAEDLPRLFDELVSPEPASERHHIRLLAAAVNSALGTDPAHVDVFAVDGARASRARYTPDVLDEPTAERETPALRQVVVVASPLPSEIAPFVGMLVHLRRRASLGMLSYLFWEREPRELHVARAECQDVPVPLRIGKDLVGRAHHRRDLARLALTEPQADAGSEIGAIDGFVAIVQPPAATAATEHAAVLEVAERGVVLVRYAIPIGPREPRAPVPLRLFVDAPRMPTNASRSQVRRDSHPIAAAESRAPALVERLLEGLARQLAEDPTAAPARDAAFALLAAAVVGPSWNVEVRGLAGALGALAAMPLVRDATGAPQPIARPWQAVVHTGRSALPEALAPWLNDVLWVPPGDPAGRLVAHAYLDASVMREQLRWARRQHRAHRKFFEHAPRAARVIATERPRLRMPLGVALETSCIPQHHFDRLAGELCLYPERTDGELVVLLEGRELERIRLVSPVGFEAVIDAPAVTPADRYRGVARDDAYAAVARAARGGIIRAVEALALAIEGRDLPRTCEVGEFGVRDHDARAIRSALQLAIAFDAPVQAPLSTAKVWRTVDDSWMSLAYLRTLAVVGLAPRNARVPNGRVVLDVEAFDQRGGPALLSQLAPEVRVVRYDLSGAGLSEPAALATALLAIAPFALAIREDGIAAAIAPTLRSTLQLRHLGVQVAELAYEPRLVAGCSLVIDSDALVPADDWKSVVDDGGLGARDHLGWETALVKAAAAALVGAAPPALIGGDPTELAGELGRVLCAVLARKDVHAATLLGAELAAQLCARPLLRVLGSARLHTIAEVAARFPLPLLIPFIDHESLPVEGYAPVIGDAIMAEAVANLADRQVIDGASELERRRQAAIRRDRVASHRAQPVRPLALPVDRGKPAVEVELVESLGPGLVAVGTGPLEIWVDIEGRPFQHIVRPDELPLRAVVELATEHADASFEALPDSIVRKLISDVQRATGRLLLATAATEPERLGRAGPVRTLCATWTEADASAERSRTAQTTAQTTAQKTATKLRDALREAVGFTSVQGERVSIALAIEPRNVLAIAAWDGDWLGPVAGEATSAYETHVVQVLEPEGELHQILQRLVRGSIVDVTPEVVRLQARRRMALGLVPTPALPHIPATRKRRLAELGPIGEAFGAGEIGLLEHGSSTALVHEAGALRDRVALDVWPAIELAIDLAEVGRLRAPALPNAGETAIEQLRALAEDPHRPVGAPADGPQALACALVRAVLASAEPAALSYALRRNLARAVLAGRLDGAALGELPAFETIGAAWVPWRALEDQRARFGSVWAVGVPTPEARPLDDSRLVLVLDPADVARARAAGHAVIDATTELELDATARHNRARPLAGSLELEPRGVLAEVALTGDGITSPRGTVAVLAASAADRRGLHPHRAMHPFGVMADRCRWPTIAVFDDARLVPDRTWAFPTTDGPWHAILEAIRTASERALASLVVPPADALAVERIVVSAAGTSDAQVHGALWLAGAPRSVQSCVVQVLGTGGSRIYVPPGDLALGGSLHVYARSGVFQELTLEQLCTGAHTNLLRAIAKLARPTDLVLAHLAHGLALGRIFPLDARKLRFDCFRPAPLDATQLVELLRGMEPVRIVAVDDDPDRPGVIDDGSALARVVIAWLGERARSGAQAPARVPRPAPPVVPAPAHPAQLAVEAVHARLAMLGVPLPGRFTITERDEPIVRYDRGLQFAGASTRLLALAGACRVNSPWATQAIDALVAHTITVLNAALTEITDATESAVLQQLLGRG